MEKFLQYKDLSYFYQTKESEIHALNNVNFFVEKNTFASLVGPSGCGKTTMLSLTAGLLEPSSGQILLDGKKIAKTLALAEELLKKYDLYAFKNKKPRQLSGGMRQRVALIRTLVLNPSLLLLDEPFSALDFQTRLNVCDDVYEIIKSEQKTALLVTHDISEALSMSDKIIILSARPATVKKELQIELSGSTPLKKREDENFGKYFELIWRNLS